MNVRRLFVASCLSLLTTSMVFAIRGDIEGDALRGFPPHQGAGGLIWGPAFWGFTLAIFVSGTIVDAVGMRVLHVLSSLGYIGGILLVLLAPRPDGPVASIFGSTGTTLLYVGFLAMGLSQGLVEGVINPLVATIYKEEKTHKLNVLHAWWPGGMVVGGVTAYVLTQFGASWQVKLAAILVPAVVYLLMILGQEYPKTERVQSERLHGRDVQGGDEPDVPAPLRLHVDDGGQRARARPVVPLDHEGPDGYPGRALPRLHRGAHVRPALLLRRRSPTRFSPFGLMMGCSILCALGLYWLGGLQPGTSPLVAFVAATLFGVGKTYYWPTMLGVTSELLPQGRRAPDGPHGRRRDAVHRHCPAHHGRGLRQGRRGGGPAHGGHPARDPHRGLRRSCSPTTRRGAATGR